MSATDDLAFWFEAGLTADVQPYLGSGRYGDNFDTVRTLPCWYVNDQVVTTQADGTEVTADGTYVYFELGRAAELPPGSKVKLSGYALARVAQRKVNDPAALDLPGHVKVTLA